MWFTPLEEIPGFETTRFLDASSNRGLASHVEHRRGEVDSHNVGAAPRKLDGIPSRTAAHIENPLAAHVTAECKCELETAMDDLMEKAIHHFLWQALLFLVDGVEALCLRFKMALYVSSDGVRCSHLDGPPAEA